MNSMVTAHTGTRRPFVAGTSRTRTVVHASKPAGFGKPKKQQASKVVTQPAGAYERGSAEWKDGWRSAGTSQELFSTGKATKAVEINQTQLCVYQFEDRVFASDALSTAFKYPLIDAKIMTVDGRPVAETPLDGTQYDLETGSVVTWCPGGGVVRGLLGRLKQDTTPIPLKVYPVRMINDSVYVKLYSTM